MTPQAMIYWSGMILATVGGFAIDGAAGMLVIGTSVMFWALFGRKA